jgi:hypothetical protein
LTASQWEIVQDLCTLLFPFVVAQKLLEGEAYVTISFIPFIIYKIPSGLQDAITNERSSRHVITTALRMLTEFNVRFGSGADGTVAIENLTEGLRRRPKGIHMIQLISSILDPRMKADVGLSPEDIEYIWDEIKQILVDHTIQISTNEPGTVPEQEEAEQQQQPRPAQLEHDHDCLFEELNLHYEAENKQHNKNNNNGDENDPEVNQHIIEQRCIAAVEAEITLYNMEPSIRLKDNNNNFNCPLSWWKRNKSKYKLLSSIAAWFLCIPATSAPSFFWLLV